MKVTSEQCRMYFHHAQFPHPSESVLSSGLGDFAQPTTGPHNPSASMVHGAGNSPVLPWALTVTSRKEEQGTTAWSSHSNSSSQPTPRGKAGALPRPRCTGPWWLLSHTCPLLFCPGGVAWHSTGPCRCAPCVPAVSCLLQCFEILVVFFPDESGHVSPVLTTVCAAPQVGLSQ